MFIYDDVDKRPNAANILLPHISEDESTVLPYDEYCVPVDMAQRPGILGCSGTTELTNCVGVIL
jgi:hypothetical protein